MKVVEDLKSAKTDEEFLGALNQWYKNSELISVNQYLQDISNNIRKVENTCGYLGQEGVNTDEILNSCAFIKAQLDAIAVEAQSREASKHIEEDAMKFIAAKKLVSIGKTEEGYKALYNLSQKNKGQIGKEAMLEAKKILGERKIQIERANGKKEQSTTVTK